MSKLKALADKLRQLQSQEVVVGVTANTGVEADEEGITVIEKAVIHELGAPEQGIAERSFLRSTYAIEKGTTARIISVDLKKVITGDARVDLPLINAGRYLASEVAKTITKGIDPPLKAATIKRKKSSKPLIDTGALLDAITYEVRDKE